MSCGPDLELASPELIEANAPEVHWTASAAGGTFRFSPDGNTVVTASPGEAAKLLSAADGSITRTLPIEGTVSSAAFSRDGALLAIGSQGFNQNLRLFRFAGGTLLFQKTAHTNGTTAVNFSPTDPALFATAGHRTTTIWRTDGTVVRTMSDGLRVLGMAYSPDGRNVASNASGNVHIWRVADGVLLRTIAARSHSAIAYSPDGTLLSTGDQLWNAATGALVRTLAWPSSGSVVTTTFTRNGAAVVTGGEDFPNMVDVATIRYFRVSDGAVLATFDQVGGSHAYVNTVAISPDGASLGYTVATDLTTVLATSPF
jgi:WD40 repeat protein